VYLDVNININSMPTPERDKIANNMLTLKKNEL
jgi:hypothetical protein